MWVFWVYAGNTTRFTEGYKEIASRLDLLKGNEQDVDILTLVHRWLSDEHNGTWLLIIDNPDAYELKFLVEFVPQSGNGTVLFTSRNRDIAALLAGSYRNVINIDVMSSVESMALLETKLEGRPHGTYEDRVKLCEALEGLPLAITQASAYINEMGPHMSIPRYLKLLEQSADPISDQHILDDDAGQPRRDTHAKNSLVTTWQVSFDQIRKDSPTAADLLSLMSFFNRRAIPAFVLKTAHIYDDTDKDHAFVDLAALQAYSLISVDQDGNTFRMHQSVQIATKRWLEQQADNRLEYWRNVFLDLLVSRFDDSTATQDSIKKNHVLLPHAYQAEPDIPTDPPGSLLWVNVMYHAGQHLMNLGEDLTAGRMFRAAAGVAKVQGNATSLIYLELLRLWGCVLTRSDRLKEAEEKFRDVLEIGGKTLLHDHPLLFESRLELAKNLDSQGNTDLAVALCLELLEQSDSPREISKIYSVLGRIKMTQEDYPLAREYLSKGLQELDKIQDRSPAICRCLLNLGITEYYLNNHSRAAELVIQARSMYSDLYGDNHVDTARCSGVLAQLREAQGRDEEALRLYETALAVFLKWYGADHVETIKIKTLIKYLEHEMRLRTDESAGTKRKEP